MPPSIADTSAAQHPNIRVRAIMSNAIYLASPGQPGGFFPTVIRQAVILAAGRGTRLGPLTKDRPKSMLPIAGKPIIARLMDCLYAGGIREFIVVVGSDDRPIADYFGNNGYTDLDIVLAHQRRPTGTVDALLQAAPYITGPFLLSAVDNITSPAHVANLIACFEVHPDHVAALSLLPTTSDEIRRSSDVLIDGDRIAGIEEKPANPRSGYAAIMLYAFSKRILDYLPAVQISARGEREIASAIQASIEDGGRVGYAITDWRLHLTQDADLLAINRYFLQHDQEHSILSDLPGTVEIIPPIRVDPGVTIGPRAILGPNVYLEQGSMVGERAWLSDCVVLRGSTVAPGTHLSHQIIASS